MKDKIKQRVIAGLESENQNTTAVRTWTPELGTRFSWVLNQFPTIKSASKRVAAKPETLTKWRDGKAQIPLGAAAVLCREAHVSFDWLVYGNEGQSATASGALDLTVMREVIQSVLEHLDMEGIELKPKDLAQICVIIYRMVVESEAVKRDVLIRNALHLVKKE